MYLFDTDTLIGLMRGGSGSPLARRIGDIPFRQQFISSISLSELVYGAHCSNRPDYHLEMIRDVLLPNVQIAVFDIQAAYQAGKLRAQLKEQGRSIDFPDLQIAAIALDRGLTLVTGNVRHFGRIPALSVENWMKR
jgi:tRNA(fMet)-specific endonuclease VapC